jgi:recombination protein RecA
MYTNQQPTGGMATKYYSSTVVKLFSSESEAQAIKGNIEVGDKLIEEKIGRKVRWELQFSKTSPAMQGGEYDFYFRGDDIGVDTIGELVDVAYAAGVVKKSGAWYNVNGEQYQGRAAVVSRVKDDPLLRDYLMKGVAK